MTSITATLFPGEDLSVPSNEHSETFLIDETINEKYSQGVVRIVTEQARYPLTAIPTMVDSEDYELNPEFQRRHRWDNKKKSRLIESFIMNVPIPPIFLYEDSFSHYEVMDGLQRLTAIKDFYQDAYSLEGLEEWNELNGRFYSNLPEQIQRGIDRRYLSSIILLQETAKTEQEALRLKQLVFERINSGGVNLEPQESRNAIYNGPLNDLCIKLARNRYLCRTWGIPEPTLAEIDGASPDGIILQNESYRKMDDVELVLRFFAQRQRLKYQKGSFKSYLDNFLKQGNLFPKSVLGQYEILFNSTIQLIYKILGDEAFWLFRPRTSGGTENWGWFKRPTTVLYDTMTFVFSQYLDKSEKIKSKSQIIKEKLPDFYRTNYDNFEARYTNLSDIEKRNVLFKSFIDEIIK